MTKVKQFSKLFLTLAIFVLSVYTRRSHSQRSIDPEMQKRIDDFINYVYLPDSETNGLGLAVVVNDNQVFYTEGYGMANQEKGIPIGNKTQFVTGSISKSITAVIAVKILHETYPELGLKVLSIPIRKLLPQVNFTLIDRYRSEHITFKDLLGHQVCVVSNEVMATAGAIKSQEELLYRARYNHACPLRSTLAYNNQIYAIAGHLAALIRNQTYEQAAREFFDEMGMFDTTVIMDSDDPDQLPHRAMPHYVKNGEIHLTSYELMKRLTLFQASGGVYITPDDMTRYMRFHINKGELDGKQIVPKEIAEVFTTSVGFWTNPSFKENNDDIVVSDIGYGLGIVLASFDGYEYNYHGGATPPYINVMSMAPAFKIRIYTATNMGPVQTDMFSIHILIFDMLTGAANPEERARKFMEKSRVKEQKKREKADKEYQAFYQMQIAKARKAKKAEVVGKYGSGTSGDIEISERFNDFRNQTEYFVEYGKWFQGWLIPGEEENMFNIEWTTDVYQDNLAIGYERTDFSFLVIDGDTLMFQGTVGFWDYFERGVSLETLPPIPWSPGSCD